MTRDELAGTQRLTHDMVRGRPRGVAYAVSPQCNDASFRDAQRIHQPPPCCALAARPRSERPSVARELENAQVR